MNILLIADFDIQGGTGTYFKRIVPYLAQKGNVHVVLSKEQSLPEVADFLRNHGVSFSSNLYLFPRIENIVMRIFRRLRLKHWYVHVKDFIVRDRLRRVYAPDLVFISQGGGDRFFAFLKADFPVIMICHSLWMENYQTKVFGNLFKKLLVSSRHLTDKRIITVSNNARELFIKDFPSAFKQITYVVPNYASSNERSVKVCRTLSSADTAIVLTLGHISVFKNPLVWLKTVSLVCERYKGKVKFLWAGRPLDWKLYCNDFARQKNAEFIGFVKDTESLYNQATIYFQPSLQESQGIAVVEALAHGVPCVVSNAGGLPESVTDGVEGFVRNCDDAAGFADCIILMLENKELLENMAHAAEIKYQAAFTQTAWKKKMDLVFDSIIS